MALAEWHGNHLALIQWRGTRFTSIMHKHRAVSAALFDVCCASVEHRHKFMHECDSRCLPCLTRQYGHGPFNQGYAHHAIQCLLATEVSLKLANQNIFKHDFDLAHLHCAMHHLLRRVLALRALEFKIRFRNLQRQRPTFKTPCRMTQYNFLWSSEQKIRRQSLT